MSAFNIDAPQSEEQQNAAAERAKALIIRELEWMERLNASEDFQRFLLAMEPKKHTAREGALAVAKHDAATRDAFNQRLMALQDATVYIPQQIAMLRATIKASNAQR